MDFVWPPDWDVVAQHVGYGAMVLSTLFVVLVLLDRMIDRFRHFFDLPGVIRDAYRWRTRTPCARTPVEIEPPAGARDLGDDHDVVPSPQHAVPTPAEELPTAAGAPGVKAVDPRYRNIRKMDLRFQVPRDFHHTLRAESRRLGKEGTDKLAEEIVERFVADLYADPEALVLRRRCKPTSAFAGEEINIKIGDGDWHLLADHRERIDWPPLLTAEFFAEIVKAGLAKIRTSRRAAVLGTKIAANTVHVGPDIHTRGVQQ